MPLTKAEISAQRKSWVIGELMLSHPEMTRDEAEAIYRRASDQIYGPFALANEETNER